MERPPNPYVVGRPIRAAEGFFGREDIFAIVEDAVSGGERTKSLALFGGRRTGKTSILWQIEGGRLGPNVVACMVNMDELGAASERKLLQEIAKRVAVKLGIGLSAIETADWSDSFSAFNTFLDQARRRLDGDVLLIMVDEFEKIAEAADQGLMARDIFGYLKHLSESDESIVLVFTGSHRLNIERDRYLSHLLAATRLHEVTCLDEADAADLVQRPAEGVIAYTEGALGRLWRLTAGHPYFIQLLCQRLYDDLALAGRTECTAEDVEAVVRGEAENPPAHLGYVWQVELATVDDRLVAAAVADLEEGHEVGVSPAQIRSKLSEAGVERTTQDVAAVFPRLRLVRILADGDSPGTVRLALGYYGYWLRKQHPLVAVAHDLSAKPRRVPLVCLVAYAVLAVVVCAAGLWGYGVLVATQHSRRGGEAPPQEPLPPALEAYPRPDLGFAIEVPRGWEEDLKVEGQIRFPEKPNSLTMVRVTLDRQNPKSAEVAQEEEAQRLAEQFGDDYRERETVLEHVSGATSAVRWDFDIKTDVTHIWLRKIAIYAARGATLYLLICQAPRDGWEEHYEDLFGKVRKALRLLREVPDVRGLTAARAERQLLDAGYDVRFNEPPEHSNRYGEHQIKSQYPPYEEPGNTVYLRVSLGPSGPAPPPRERIGLELVRRPELGVNVQVPRDWQRYDLEDVAGAGFSEDRERGVAIEIQIGAIDARKRPSIDKVLQAALDRRDEYGGLHPLGSTGEYIKGVEDEGRRRDFEFTVADQTYHGVILCALRKEWTYQVFCRAPSSRYEAYAEVFDKAIDSLTLFDRAEKAVGVAED